MESNAEFWRDKQKPEVAFFIYAVSPEHSTD